MDLGLFVAVLKDHFQTRVNSVDDLHRHVFHFWTRFRALIEYISHPNERWHRARFRLGMSNFRDSDFGIFASPKIYASKCVLLCGQLLVGLIFHTLTLGLGKISRDSGYTLIHAQVLPM